MTQVNKQVPQSPKQAACCVSELDTLLDPAIFKALGDPTRLKLLSCIARCARACTTTEVAECCSVDFSVVARHLALLSDVGILDSQKQGRTVYYSVRYETLSGLFGSISDAIADCGEPLCGKAPGKSRGRASDCCN